MQINEVKTTEITERPGKEIRINKSLSLNKNITGRIGTLDNKNHPKTVYIIVSFWVDIKEKLDDNNEFDRVISKKLAKELNNIYRVNLYNILNNNKYFPFKDENIYIYDFPENLNYNNKKSFVSIELDLHTLNNIDNNSYSLKNQNNNELFTELLKIFNVIATSDLLTNKKEFSIHKTKR